MKKHIAKRAARKQKRAARDLARNKHKESRKKRRVRDVKKVTGWVKKTKAAAKEVKGKEKREKRKVAEAVKTRKAKKQPGTIHNIISYMWLAYVNVGTRLRCLFCRETKCLR